jgi:RNA-directed DNA polymerase
VHLDDGFDFLGFNVRRYRGKLLIKPSKAAIGRIRRRLSDEMRRLRGSNAAAVVRDLLRPQATGRDQLTLDPVTK